MILQELFSKVNYQEIWPVIWTTFYEDIPNWRIEELRQHNLTVEEWKGRLKLAYGQAIEEMYELVPIAPKDPIILVAYDEFEWSDDDHKSEGDLSIFGIIPGTHEHYGLMGISWNELLACEVYQKSIDTYGLTVVAINLLHELTFNGYTSFEVEKRQQELVESLKEAEKEYENGEYYTMEDMYEKGIFERPTPEKEAKRKTELEMDGIRYAQYQKEEADFLKESGWIREVK